MSPPGERHVQVNRRRCRVWEKGEGEPLGFLGGLRGLPRWPRLLDRLAERRRVIAPSLPGHPGATGFDEKQAMRAMPSSRPMLRCRASNVATSTR